MTNPLDTRPRAIIDNERDAASCFRYLIAGDPHADDRAELHAAGVSGYRIESLYPTNFADIAPAIERHLPRLPAGFLSQGVDWQWTTKPEAMRDEFMRLANEDQQRRFVQEYLAYSPALQTTDPRVRSLLVAIQSLLRTEVPTMEHRAGDIYNALYWAWWFMQHRTEFTSEMSQIADMMMLWTATHVLFDIHLMLDDAAQSSGA